MLKIKQNSNLIITTDQPLYASLKKVRVTATICSVVADVTITEVFQNDEKTPIECVYYFPMEKQVNIYVFAAQIDERKIVKLLKANNDGSQQNHQSDIFKQDNFVIDIGALPPSKECTITINYHTKLNFVHESTLQFVVPTIVPSACEYVQLSPYIIEFDCQIEEMNGSQPEQSITRISSTSYPIQVNFTQQNTCVVTFVQQNNYFNQNIVLNIDLTDTKVIFKPNNPMTAFPLINEDWHRTTDIITSNTVGQPFDYYCVLDFEAVCHQVDPNLKQASPNDSWEIIEFPICLLEAETNSIVDIYHSYVRPTIKTRLNNTCIAITGITQDIVDNSPTFDIVWKDIHKFLAKHSLISLKENNSKLHSFTWITCGNWDLRAMLPLQLKQSGFDRPEFINNFINLKDLYMEYYPSTRIRGMKDMLKYSNLKLEGKHHSGIDDTKNIARIAQWLITNNKILKLIWKGNNLQLYD